MRIALLLFTSMLVSGCGADVAQILLDQNGNHPISLSLEGNRRIYPSVESFEPEAQKKLFSRLCAMAENRRHHQDQQVTPIFVIISVLIKSLLSYVTRIDAPVELIIHDNHTTYPPTKEFLRRLAQAGVRVVYHDLDVVHDYALSGLSTTISQWFESNDSPYYVVTDPDIEIEESAGDILEVFSHLLCEFTNVQVVGPILRRDDLPDHYPLKQRVQTEQDEVHRNDPIFYKPYKNGALTLQAGYIDTAFGMYRKSFNFHNYNRAIQVHDRYQARHLDWYINPTDLTPDQIFYKQKNSPVGHWGSTWLP